MKLVSCVNNCFRRIERWARRFRSRLRIHKIDSSPVPDDPGEIRLFVVVRNESLRLPYLFEYYFDRGVDRAFVIDNGSTDDTVSFLHSQKNTHIFHTGESYKYHGDWIDFLLHRYGVGNWCVVVDADELLVYPHWEKLSLRGLSDFLGRQGYSAMHCLLLDMYSDRPIGQTSYKRSDNPLLICPFFDPDSHKRIAITPLPRSSQASKFIYGVRKRVFGIDVCLSKFPLVRFKPDMFLLEGTHFIEKASIADIEGVSLHFKYFNDFHPRVTEEARRGEHWDNAAEYKVYVKKIKQNPKLSIYYSKSLQFTGSEQLLDLGIMKTSADLDAFAEAVL